MTRKPFYQHTSILLAIAFVSGVGVGSLTDSLQTEELSASVIQNSAFVRSIGHSSSVREVGEVLAYNVSDGDVIRDLGADSEDVSSDDPRATPEVLPVPEKETPSTAHPKRTEPVLCDFEKPAKPVYKATPLTASQSFSAEPGDLIRVSLSYKNDGNMPWFADDSGCQSSVLQLGTTRELDRESLFYSDGIGSGWFEKNRVSMSEGRVDPGQEATFSFDMRVPDENDLYREYFSAMVPGAKWIENSESYLDIEVGEPYDRTTLLKKMNYLNSSVRADAIDLDAEKSIEVDLSEQRANVKLGDYVVRSFLVSSGAKKHPTPIGNYHIEFKQPVRIAADPPFYIMPVFQGLVRDGYSFVGYGFHALPSLGSSALRAKIKAALGKGERVPTEWFSDDSFWTEARDHIGTPRSHGCVRFLPDDANFVYEFSEIGTKVIVKQ
jgi:lipoprotein-anchoring transpeptidase ErfK/SrfK